MGRGLSQLQKAILEVLEGYPTTAPRNRSLPTTGDILDALGRERSPVNYASVSRAIDRLSKRHLVDVYHTELRLPGNGVRYAKAASSS